MFRYLFLFIGFFTSSISAQIIDDFNDSDVTFAPKWQGNLTEFTSNSVLRSNCSTANSVFYISTDCSVLSEFEWSLETKLSFNTSSLNYVDLVLSADSNNLKSYRNGYFVRLGGSSDEFSLYKMVNGAESKVIDGKDAVLNSSFNHYKVFVKLLNDSFKLYRLNLQSNQMVLEGTCKANLSLLFANCGIKIRQSTTSFFYKHQFDDLYIGEIEQDTIPPVIDSLQCINYSMLKLYFNEPIDTLKMSDTLMFQVGNTLINPYKIQWQNTATCAILFFRHSFKYNTSYEILVKEVSDIFGNTKDRTHSFFTLYKVPPEKGDIVITELMVDPEPVKGLPNSEYVELKNISNKYLDLNGIKIHDPTTYKWLPNKVLKPDSFVLLENIPSLNNGSDDIYINNLLNKVICRVKYNDTWYRDSIKSKGGYSLEIIDPYKLCLGSDNWRASIANEGGTPGKVNSVNAKLPNDTIAPQITEINLEYPNKISLLIDQEFDSLSSTLLEIKLNNKVINYSVLFRQNNYLEILLNTSLSDTATYSVSIAEFKDCSGNVSLSQSYHLKCSSTPELHDIIINEVLFNPFSGGSDFVELYNRSNRVVDASKLYISELNNGQTTSIFQLTKQHLFIQPNQYVLLSVDTNSVCKQYQCKTEGLKLQLSKMPTMPDEAGSIGIVNINGEIIDSLSYSDDWHFRLLNDHNGVSLERLNPNNFENNSNNWYSASASRGFATPAGQNSYVVVPIKVDKYFSTNTKTLTPNGDGNNDLVVFDFELPVTDVLLTVKIFDINGRMCRELMNNSTVGSKGNILWDGLGNNGNILDNGVYLVCFDGYSQTTSKIQQIITVVLYSKK